MINKNDIPYKWKVMELSDIVEIESGDRPEGDIESYASDIPSIGGSEIDSKGNLHLESSSQIPRYYYDNMNTGVIEPRDILLVKDGTNTGDTVTVNENFNIDAAVNSHVYILRIKEEYKEEILHNFLGLFIRSPISQNHIKKAAKGSAQKGINMKFAEDLKVPVPPLDEQEEIVREIEERFDTIDNLEQSVKNLKQLTTEYKESLFASLYSGKNTSSKESTIWAFEEDVFPEVWDIKELGSICDVNPRGISIPDEESVPHIPMDAIGEKSKKIDRYERKENIYSGLSKFEKGDILLAKITPCFENGKVAVVDRIPDGYDSAVGTTELVVIRPGEKVKQDYIFKYLQSPMVREWGKRRLLGSTGRERINVGQFRENLYVPVPPLDEQEEIVREIERIDMGLVDKSLEDVEVLFDEYRGSVLDSAFRGELTNEDREEDISISGQSEITEFINM